MDSCWFGDSNAGDMTIAWCIHVVNTPTGLSAVVFESGPRRRADRADGRAALPAGQLAADAHPLIGRGLLSAGR